LIAVEVAAFSCNCSLTCTTFLSSAARCAGPIPSAVTEQPDANIARTTIEEIHFNMYVTKRKSLRAPIDPSTLPSNQNLHGVSDNGTANCRSRPEAAGRERQLSGWPVRVPERRYTATRATSSCIEKSCNGGCLEFLGCGIRARAQVAQPRFELAVGAARATPSRSGER
jgi:hypothetical protein